MLDAVSVCPVAFEIYERLKKNMGSKNKLKNLRKNKKQKELEYNLFESDDTFAFIAGYTSGGFAYCITWEEMEDIERRDKEPLGEDRNLQKDEEIDLPFD